MKVEEPGPLVYQGLEYAMIQSWNIEADIGEDWREAASDSNETQKLTQNLKDQFGVHRQWHAIAQKDVGAHPHSQGRHSEEKKYQ